MIGCKLLQVRCCYLPRSLKKSNVSGPQVHVHVNVEEGKFRLVYKEIHTYGNYTVEIYNGGKTQVSLALDCSCRSDTSLSFDFKAILEAMVFVNSSPNS